LGSYSKMNLRNATEADLRFVAEHSISHGPKECPSSIDFVYALEHDGDLLGVGGIKLLNATTAWAWFDLTEYARHHMKDTYRVIRDWMEKLMKTHNLTRLMAAVECDFGEAIRTAEHLGFHIEGVMENFFGDKSAYCYAKFAGGTS